MLRRTVRDFASRTTIHGISHAAQMTTVSARIFWVCLLLVGLTGFITNVWFNVNEFLHAHPTSKIFAGVVNFSYPDITVCYSQQFNVPLPDSRHRAAFERGLAACRRELKRIGGSKSRSHSPPQFLKGCLLYRGYKQVFMQRHYITGAAYNSLRADHPQPVVFQMASSRSARGLGPCWGVDFSSLQNGRNITQSFISPNYLELLVYLHYDPLREYFSKAAMPTDMGALSSTVRLLVHPAHSFPHDPYEQYLLPSYTSVAGLLMTSHRLAAHCGPARHHRHLNPSFNTTRTYLSSSQSCRLLNWQQQLHATCACMDPLFMTMPDLVGAVSCYSSPVTCTVSNGSSAL